MLQTPLGTTFSEGPLHYQVGVCSLAEEECNVIYRGCLSTLTLSILTLLKVSFSDILSNDYLDHFDTFGKKFDFDTFKNGSIALL